MRFIILQNTTAPYRTSLFNNLYDLGLNIKLMYMCELEKERSWKVDYSAFRFPYYVDKGYYFHIAGRPFHWNPKIIVEMCKAKESKLVLGGSWNDLNVICLCLLKRLGIIKQEVIFWSEANYLTVGAMKKSRLRDLLRTWVLNTGEGRVIIPGRMAEVTFQKWGIRNKSFIRLPNVIDETILNTSFFFGRTFTPTSDLPRFIMPVRLNERIKGIMNFFTAIGSEGVKRARFEVLGNGEDEGVIKCFIKDNGYEENIILRGFCDMETVARYYKVCDAIVLPSFSDPSPLSLVEACCAKIPILASNRCGNHFETILDGLNGYLFNPECHHEIKESFEQLLARRNEWDKMGEISGRLFDENFKHSKVLPGFVNQIQ